MLSQAPLAIFQITFTDHGSITFILREATKPTMVGTPILKRWNFSASVPPRIEHIFIQNNL